MNDFFKTKVGFTVGLLAAAFTIQPIIQTNSDIGFLYLNFKITILHAYNLLMICLGLSVYSNSLQFATDKHFPLLDKLSNTCYSIALSIPLLYSLFWLVNLVIDNMSLIGLDISPHITHLIVGTLTGMMSVFLFLFLSKSLKLKFDVK